MDDLPAHSGIKWNGHVGVVEYGDAMKMVVMFYNRAERNTAKSTQEGRPYYEDVVFVRIHPPGERLNIIERRATDADKRRWAVQWQQFLQNKQQIPEGTPIDLLYPDQPSVAAMLRANGVHTVEQCAELSGNAIDTIGMGAQKYVNAAQKYLEVSNRGVKASQMQRELEERDLKISRLEHTVEDLKNALAHSQQTQSQPSPEMLQTLLAQLMGRPQHLPNTNFDAQTAVINATGEALREKPRTRRKLKG